MRLEPLRLLASSLLAIDAVFQLGHPYGSLATSCEVNHLSTSCTATLPGDADHVLLDLSLPPGAVSVNVWPFVGPSFDGPSLPSLELRHSVSKTWHVGLRQSVDPRVKAETYCPFAAPSLCEVEPLLISSSLVGFDVPCLLADSHCLPHASKMQALPSFRILWWRHLLKPMGTLQAPIPVPGQRRHLEALRSASLARMKMLAALRGLLTLNSRSLIVRMTSMPLSTLSGVIGFSWGALIVSVAIETANLPGGPIGRPLRYKAASEPTFQVINSGSRTAV